MWRQELLAAGTLTPTNDGFLQFTQPYRFATANEAAEVLVARAVNAQLAWKHASGKQVRDFK